eukprot:gb/GEZN01005897.1/.p1 GENE.gb/GEZN01005897.1/~~gb/GEZN01005897.1/.p1  ORF type:complete len:383 (-),score=50.48 gb/GEZN01005897.1/:112-1260(-)
MQMDLTQKLGTTIRKVGNHTKRRFRQQATPSNVSTQAERHQRQAASQHAIQRWQSTEKEDIISLINASSSLTANSQPPKAPKEARPPHTAAQVLFLGQEVGDISTDATATGLQMMKTLEIMMDNHKSMMKEITKLRQEVSACKKTIAGSEREKETKDICHNIYKEMRHVVNTFLTELYFGTNENHASPHTPQNRLAGFIEKTVKPMDVAKFILKTTKGGWNGSTDASSRLSEYATHLDNPEALKEDMLADRIRTHYRAITTNNGSCATLENNEFQFDLSVSEELIVRPAVDNCQQWPSGKDDSVHPAWEHLLGVVEAFCVSNRAGRVVITTFNDSTDAEKSNFYSDVLDWYLNKNQYVKTLWNNGDEHVFEEEEEGQGSDHT